MKLNVLIFVGLLTTLTTCHPVYEVFNDDHQEESLVSELSIDQSDNVHKLQFTALGEKYSFDLVPANSIFAPGFKVTYSTDDSNTTIVDHNQEKIEGNFYTDSEGFGSYYIEITDGEIKLDGIVGDHLRIQHEDGVHKVYRNAHYNISDAFTGDQLYFSSINRKGSNARPVDDEADDLPPLPDTVTIRIFAVLDSYLYKSLKKKKTPIDKYLGLLWNAVTNKYKTIDHPTIKFAVAGSTILPKKNWMSQSMVRYMGPNTVNGNLLASNFGEWLYAMDNDPSIPMYHVAVLHTGLDLAKPERGNRFNKAQLGVAFDNGLCKKDDEEKIIVSAGLMEDRDPKMTFANVVVVAHEIGHLFGMIHDDAEPAGNHCPQHYIMYYLVDKKTIEKFSECSVKRIRAHLSSPESACVRIQVDNVQSNKESERPN